MNMMKHLRSTLLLLSLSTSLEAQVLNPGFEMTRPDGTAANWEPRLTLSVEVGATDTCLTDSLCYLTDDSHTGKKALALQNALCSGGVVYGRVFSSDDIPAYSPSAPFAERPDYFSFYYKFFPRGGEGIRMETILNDANGAMIATADTLFYPGTVTSYSRIQVPVLYLDVTQPERIFLRFNLVDSLGGTGSMAPGSRLLLDDIAAGKQTTGIGTPGLESNALQCYPVPAGDFIFIRLKGVRAAAPYTILLTDAGGRLVKKLENISFADPVKLDIGSWPAGLYFIRVLNAGGVFQSRFVHHKS